MPLINEIADNLAKEAIKAAEEDWYETVETTWVSLQYAANNFLTAYYHYQQNTNFSDLLSQSILSQSGGEIWLQRNSYLAERAIYLLALKFQNQYQKYIGIQPSEVAYVTHSGKIYIGPIQYLALSASGPLDKMRVGGLAQILTKELANKKEQSRVKIPVINSKLLEGYNKIKNKMEKFYTQLQNATSTLSYEEKITSPFYFALNNNVDTPKAAFIRQNAYVPYGSKIYKILNYGDLKEGFVRAWNEGGVTERKILNSLLQVDNISGFGQEDVSNFAVKSERASLPELQPFVTAAELINSSNIQIMADDLKKSLNQHVGAVRNQVIQDIQQLGTQPLVSGLDITLQDILSNI